MPNEPPADFSKTGALVQYFQAEHSPLEALLACILDAQKGIDWSTSRAQRIRQALKALTDRDADWIDDPSGDHSWALYRMAEYSYKEYIAGLKPEYGGPPYVENESPQELSSVSELAKRARIELGLDESDEEILRKKFTATYGKNVRAKTSDYMVLQNDRVSSFDADAERRMLADFQEINTILEKYNINLELERVFSRTAGKLAKKVPTTG